jgi:hypothetical protein
LQLDIDGTLRAFYQAHDVRQILPLLSAGCLLSGVSSGVTLSERLLKTPAATGAPAALLGGLGLRGGVGLLSFCRFCRAFSIASSIAVGFGAWFAAAVQPNSDFCTVLLR